MVDDDDDDGDDDDDDNMDDAYVDNYRVGGDIFKKRNEFLFKNPPI